MMTFDIAGAPRGLHVLSKVLLGRRGGMTQTGQAREPLFDPVSAGRLQPIDFRARLVKHDPEG